ncbi:MAG TPA: hypothetical protein VGR74_06455 [Actinomycetota bacterium]|nr:hypothetical protein [Actinomycetota bacterium]
MPDHPDHEQLAAFQAGDGDRRQRSQVAAHVASCASCAEVVAAVEQARKRLALLGEPELPAGLHGRLAGAVATEVVRGTPPRRPAWYRRPATWGAAAAALLLAALVVPLLHRPDVLTGGAGGGAGAGGGQAQEAPAPAAGGADKSTAAGLPVLRLGGEVTAKRLRAALASNPVAMRAYRRAVAGGGEQRLHGAATPESRPAPAPAAPSTTAPPQPCLAAATARAGRPLVPAFLVEGNWQGRPATMLVTSDAGDPNRADLFVFPRGDCSGPPLATERL